MEQKSQTDKNKERKRSKIAKARKGYCDAKVKAYSDAHFDFNPNNHVNFRNDLYFAMKEINKDSHINPASVEILHDFISQEMLLILKNAQKISLDLHERNVVQKDDIKTAIKLRFQSFYEPEELNYLLDYGEKAIKYRENNE